MTLAKQPVLRSKTRIQKINISQFNVKSRSVFVTAVGAILEGERDYSEQILATPTLQRSHVLGGVVNIVLVSLKVRGVESRFVFI